MAQPGQTTIQLYSTTTTATTPSPSNLVSGELALNLTDKKLFTKDSSGNVIEMTPSPTNALAVGSGGTGATSAASARANLDALAATNPSYTGTLTGGTGVVNLGSGQFVKDAAGSLQTTTTSAAAATFNSTNAAGSYISCQNNGTVTVFIGSALSLLGDTASDGAIRAPGSLRFGSGGGYDRGRFDASGNLLVGTTSGDYHTLTKSNTNSFAAIVNNTNTNNGFVLALQSASAAGTGWNFIDAYSGAGATLGFRVAGNGNVVNTNNSYGAISDLKLKESITDASPKLSKLMQVRIVNYTLKADPTKAKLIGVIAQELEQISPGLIEESHDYEEVKKTREVEVPAVDAVLDDEGNEVSPAVKATTRTEEYTERVDLGTTTKSVKYSVFVPMLIKGMQEQQAQIEALQAQLDEQNTAMQLLASRLAALEAA